MALLLAEQTLLLALDDATGSNTAQWAGDAGLAAALLLDLGQAGLLRADAGELVAVPGPAPEPGLLAAAWRLLRGAPEPRGAKHWVGRLPRELSPLRDRLARGLVDRGVLAEERVRVLGLFPQTRFPAVDPAPEAELRGRLVDVLVGGRAPTEEEALLVGLLEPMGLVDRLVPRDQRRTARRRAGEIGRQGVAGSAVRDAVREVQAAVITAAVIVPAVVGGSS